MEEQLCAHCGSRRIVRVRRTAFTDASRCLHCGRSLPYQLLSVVLVDVEDARRERLVSLLRAEGIPVVPVNQIASLERWPVGEVVVTDVAHSTQWWTNVGATHVIVLADTDEERELAQRSGAFTIVASRNPAALLTILRTAAEAAGARDPT